MHDISSLPAVASLPLWLRRDLRSDHAGETGAVYIYRGILAITRDPAVRTFAREHLATEMLHLDAFERWLGRHQRSALLPLWRVAGWALGAVAVLGGRRGVFVTIEAVETFVVQHYQGQIEAIGDDAALANVAALLSSFMHDEDHHRDDACRRLGRAGRWPARLWAAIVGSGSAGAVVLARRF